MPTYEYRCTQCSHSLEIMQKITADPLNLCPQCGHEALRRGPGGGIGLHFNGTGFYKTDYTPNIVPDTHLTKPPGCCPCGKNQTSCEK